MLVYAWVAPKLPGNCTGGDTLKLYCSVHHGVNSHLFILLSFSVTTFNIVGAKY